MDGPLHGNGTHHPLEAAEDRAALHVPRVTHPAQDPVVEIGLLLVEHGAAGVVSHADQRGIEVLAAAVRVVDVGMVADQGVQLLLAARRQPVQLRARAEVLVVPVHAGIRALRLLRLDADQKRRLRQPVGNPVEGADDLLALRQRGHAAARGTEAGRVRTRDVGVGVAQPHLAHRLRVRIGGEQPVAAEPGSGAGEQRQVDPLQAGQRRAGIVDVVQPHLQRAAAQGEYDVEAQSRVDRDGVSSLASAGLNRDVELVPGLVGAVDAQPAAGSARAEGAPAPPVDVAAEQRQVAMQRYRQLVALQEHFGIVHRRPGYPEAKMTETAAGLLDHAQRPRRGGTPGRSSGTRSPRRSHGGAPGVSAVEDSSRR